MYRYRAVEAGLILIAIWWGVVFSIMPKSSFANQMYSHMSTVMSEKSWAVSCLTLATIMLLGVVTDKKVVQAAGLLISSGFWIFVSASLWLSDHYTTGTSYAVWAILSTWSYVCLMRGE
ncbi:MULTISPECIES: hypothetical protein [Bacillus]|uniref:hypothetical protein n=1 Tax=Bacillus TaxID=1386 RepID=UPI0011E8C398|nr:hypothetical protein [Bacillus pumilus]TYS40475.1 hypothetical protein FZC68_16840 [Bacillus pumilus]